MCALCVTLAAGCLPSRDAQGELPPIIVSLVRKDRAVNQLLDDASAARSEVISRMMHAHCCNAAGRVSQGGVHVADVQLDEVKDKVHRLLKSDASSAELVAGLELLAPSVVDGLMVRGVVYQWCMYGTSNLCVEITVNRLSLSLTEKKIERPLCGLRALWQRTTALVDDIRRMLREVPNAQLYQVLCAPSVPLTTRASLPS